LTCFIKANQTYFETFSIASTIVELSIKRSHKMTRPTSVGIVPTTPILSGRDRTASITGPQPVDVSTFEINLFCKQLYNITIAIAEH